MFKVIFLAKKCPTMTHEEFTHYFYETHVPLAKKIPGAKKYVTNEIIGGPQGKPEWDWVSEMWFESKETMEAGFASSAGKEALGDCANIIESHCLAYFIVDEKQWV